MRQLIGCIRRRAHRIRYGVGKPGPKLQCAWCSKMHDIVWMRGIGVVASQTQIVRCYQQCATRCQWMVGILGDVVLLLPQDRCRMILMSVVCGRKYVPIGKQHCRCIQRRSNGADESCQIASVSPCRFQVLCIAFPLLPEHPSNDWSVTHFAQASQTGINGVHENPVLLALGMRVPLCMQVGSGPCVLDDGKLPLWKPLLDAFAKTELRPKPIRGFRGLTQGYPGPRCRSTVQMACRMKDQDLGGDLVVSRQVLHIALTGCVRLASNQKDIHLLRSQRLCEKNGHEQAGYVLHGVVARGEHWAAHLGNSKGLAICKRTDDPQDAIESRVRFDMRCCQVKLRPIIRSWFRADDFV